MIDAFTQICGSIIRKGLREEGTEFSIDLLIINVDDLRDLPPIVRQARVDLVKTGIGHGRIAGGIQGRRVGSRMIGQIDSGHICAVGTGIHDVRAPLTVGHGVCRGKWSVGMARCDEVDAGYIPREVYVFTGSTGGIGP